MRRIEDLPGDAWAEVDVVGDDIEDALLADARRCPAARTPIGVNVYERSAVNELLRDPRAACRMDLLALAQGIVDGPLHELYAADILSTNGPDHLRVRTIVSRAMTPKRVAGFRPRIRDVIEELVGAVDPSGPVEAMGAFVDELPIRTICHLLGVDREEERALHRWIRVLPAMLSVDARAHEAELLDAYRNLHERARAHLLDRRAHPTDDLTTAIALAEADGDRLSEAEAERFWVGLLNAGQETTRNVLGRGLIRLAARPDQWALLRADPEGLAATATEEILRLEPNTPIIAPRLAEADLELVLDGEPFAVPAGTVLFPVHSAANRDQRAYGDHADDLDITRAVDPPHLTFGAGPHFCAGASLARAEIAEALAALAARFAHIELAGAPTWNAGGGMRSLETLPLHLHER